MIKFDSDKNAIFNPFGFGLTNFPSKALMIYDDFYFEKLMNEKNLVEVVDSGGIKRKNYYFLDNEYLIINPGEGAPTSAIMIENAIASGIKSVVAFGTAGSLEGSKMPHNIIIPSSAIREEGVSYHYCEESNEIKQEEASIKILRQEFDKKGISYIIGKTWTTDAFYRETIGKLDMMKNIGCICVDMECSALIAISRFRNIKFAQFLITFDNLEADYNHRDNYKNLLEDTILEVAFSSLDVLSNIS